MEITKLIIVLCCIYNSMATHSHTIPVEEYKTELHDLGQHIEYPETPVKVIKITKTVAVKVPVPYPVKVVEKVPYPVHVNKPYPVPVPQVIKVPAAPEHAPSPLPAHHPLGLAPADHHSYHGQEQQAPEQQEHSYEGHGQNEHEQSYAPTGYDHADSYQGSGPSGYAVSDDSEGHISAESSNYQRAIQDFLNKHNLNSKNNFPFH